MAREITAFFIGLSPIRIGILLDKCFWVSADKLERVMDADRFVAREIQQTALRALPLLVRELTVNQKGIELIASAAAPHGLTENMKFFINGHPSDEVESVSYTHLRAHET